MLIASLINLKGDKHRICVKTSLGVHMRAQHYSGACWGREAIGEKGHCGGSCVAVVMVVMVAENSWGTIYLPATHDKHNITAGTL